MKVLLEKSFKNKSYVVESDGVKKYYMEGITIEMNIFNENGRRYKTSIIDEALDRYFEKFRLGKNTYGVLNHPFENSEDANYVNPKEVSHLFVSLEKISPDAYSTKSLVMDTPNGKIVKAFIDAEAVLGISTRGFGDSQPVKNEDGREDIINFEFITLGDYVTDPSAPNAYLNAIMEKKDWLFNLGKNKKQKIQLNRHLDRSHKALSKAKLKNLDKSVLGFFNEYFDILMNRFDGE